jgi:hypothetical protein
MVAPVLRRNYCNLEEAERTLKRYLKYPELIILYQTKGLHQKALSLLRSQADVADSPLRGIDTTIHYLQNLGQSAFLNLLGKKSRLQFPPLPEELCKSLQIKVIEGISLYLCLYDF